MSRYIRPHVAGLSASFTVTLDGSGSRLRVEHIGALRDAVRLTRAERRYRIDARVVLPDHLHAV